MTFPLVLFPRVARGILSRSSRGMAPLRAAFGPATLAGVEREIPEPVASRATAMNLCTAPCPTTLRPVREDTAFSGRSISGFAQPTAHQVFELSWGRIERQYGKDITIPREIVFLNGAPGAGKGATTSFILKSRGLGRAISMSKILALYPDSKKLMDQGDLIPDRLVIDALLAVVFDPASDDGIGLIVDGFPRTEFQVDLLRLLHDRLQSLHRNCHQTERGHLFPRPSFKMVVLYVDEETSIQRQMGRGQKVSVKNARALDAGSDKLDPLRPTDISEAHARKRYQTFKEHYGAILHLKDVFPFHLIDGMGSMEDTRRQIAKELRYQSSMDLSGDTYAAIRHLPMAKELSRRARQELTRRLDSYVLANKETFQKVIGVINDSVLPILRRCGMAGESVFHTTDHLFHQHPVAIDMLIDVLTDRGFHVSYQQTEERTPVRVDLATGEVSLESHLMHRFKMTFKASYVRDAYSDVGLRSNAFFSEGDESKVTRSFVPGSFDHQVKYTQPGSRESMVSKITGESTNEVSFQNSEGLPGGAQGSKA